MNKNLKEVFGDNIKAVIFDVDGTLFSLSKMHFCMTCYMFVFFLFRPWRVREAFIIYKFRKLREGLRLSDCENIHFEQYNIVAKKINIDVGSVKEIVNFWMFEIPLKFIGFCKNSFVIKLIKELEKKNIKIIYFSDYRPDDKIKKLGLNIEFCYDASSEMINKLKPSVFGLELIMKDLCLSASEIVYIGDSYENDGLLAEKTKVYYFPVQKFI